MKYICLPLEYSQIQYEVGSVQELTFVERTEKRQPTATIVTLLMSRLKMHIWPF